MNKYSFNLAFAIDTDFNLIVTDTTVYDSAIHDNYNEYAFVELVYDIDNENVLASKIIELSEDFRPTAGGGTLTYKSVSLPTDGYFNYMKVIVPTVNHYTTYPTVPEGKFLFVVKDGSLLQIVNGKGPITVGVQALFDARDNFYTVETEHFFEYGPGSIFSIERIKQCLLNMEKKMLLEYDLKGVDFSCSKTSSLRYERDLLLAAYRVLSWLSQLGKFDEAIAILDRITKCGGICSEANTDAANGGNCGCGKK